ncbi:MAG: metalloregulator ArsR/SmtB family transcription factor [Gammaproteobacteria bacterium]|nr:metalloregulator ArsR/SmtB family transcription factor [Gammaproteobacteria bacterium]NND58824.1 metalloregulator ArsR/SmtB family transcription factor [Gammaproteobacteria bacterium]
MTQSLQQIIDALRAAAEPTRLRLLAICSEGELTVSEITHIVNQSQPRVSRHLKLLCNAGLLDRFREGHFVLYRAAPRGDTANLVDHILGMVDPQDEQMDVDRHRMEKIKAERARRAADFLRFNSEDWARLREADVADSEINRIIVDMIDTSDVGDLIDIGTGTGRMLKLLGRHAESAVGIDISPDMLAVARSNLHAAGLGKVMVRRADMYGLPYPDASFDTVTMDHVLYQADDPPRAVREAARILRPGGQLLLVEFAMRERDNGHQDNPGVSDDDLASWCHAANLDCDEFRHIDGQSFSVVLTVARKKRLERTAVA